MSTLENLNFTNGFARLPEAFHSRVRCEPLRGAFLAAFNTGAARLLDLDPAKLQEDSLLQVFGGERLLSAMEPVAALYAGHQFGHLVPQLGDGRALLLGEVTNRGGERWEIQLKGSGKTPYSRDGDGRAVLRSSVREYLCSEAMHGLGIPTTRALALIGSSEEVYRERIEPGAMLVRMAPSHVRFGSFEVFYYRGQFDRLRELADYLIRDHFPALADQPRPYAALLQEVIERTAGLIAQWQLAGFAHGVMNTDNMSMLGLTLDYGPYGFLDAYDPGFVCNHSDHTGRYAFDRQPQIGLWNLSCLAQAMLPLLDGNDGEAAAEEARGLLVGYEPVLQQRYMDGLRAKLGLREARPEDADLAQDLLGRMAHGRVDYTLLFRALGEVRQGGADGDRKARDLFVDREAFDQWAGEYRRRLRGEAVEDQERRAAMDRVNPKYILRNYLAQQAIERAEEGDYTELERLRGLLEDPYAERPEMAAYAAEPPDWAGEIEVSCSS